MSELAEALKKRGYKVLGNLELFPDPIFAINEQWLNSADECDRERILEQIINYCNKKLEGDDI